MGAEESGEDIDARDGERVGVHVPCADGPARRSIGAGEAAADEAEACLLYTSRCV